MKCFIQNLLEIDLRRLSALQGIHVNFFCAVKFLFAHVVVMYYWQVKEAFRLSFVCYIWPQSKLSNDTRQTTLENFLFKQLHAISFIRYTPYLILIDLKCLNSLAKPNLDWWTMNIIFLLVLIPTISYKRYWVFYDIDCWWNVKRGIHISKNITLMRQSELKNIVNIFKQKLKIRNASV